MSLERFTRKTITIAHPNDSAAEVAACMKSGVGAVVVAVEGRPVGIVTDRDLALRVVADRMPLNVAIHEVMTRDPAMVRIDDTIDVAVTRMRERGVRRLPIVDHEGVVVGLVALDDLLVLLAGELHAAANAVRHNAGP
jgi:CBS domain-containing protein